MIIAGWHPTGMVPQVLKMMATIPGRSKWEGVASTDNPGLVEQLGGLQAAGDHTDDDGDGDGDIDGDNADDDKTMMLNCSS